MAAGSSHPLFADPIGEAGFFWFDRYRQGQAEFLDLFGLGAQECAHTIVGSGPNWRLRHYGEGTGAPQLLMVPAPIKRPYIWDLTPEVSVVRACLDAGFGVHLIEWIPPADDDPPAGFEAYAGTALAACVAHVAATGQGAAPIVLGHSIGGTLAAAFCAAYPGSASGLVLLAAPLCFHPGVSPFRDGLVKLVPEGWANDDVVPGSVLSFASGAASPHCFVWERWMDVAQCVADPAALDIHARIERWALDEVALSGRLLTEIVQWLYREDRLCCGTLELAGRTVGPQTLTTPLLAVVCAEDEVGPAESVQPFIARMPIADAQVLSHPAEVGVGLQHLAILTGRKTHVAMWPRILDWMKAHG